jgi:hypothetical protein
MEEYHARIVERGPQAAAAEKAKLAAQKAWQTRRASPNYVALDRLRHLRGPGESYSDVIIRLAKGEGGDLMTTH